MNGTKDGMKNINPTNCHLSIILPSCMAKAVFLLTHYYQPNSSQLLLREEQQCSRSSYLIVRIRKKQKNWLVGIAQEDVLSILSFCQLAFVSDSYLETLEKQTLLPLTNIEHLSLALKTVAIERNHKGIMKFE